MLTQLAASHPPIQIWSLLASKIKDDNGQILDADSELTFILFFYSLCLTHVSHFYLAFMHFPSQFLSLFPPISPPFHLVLWPRNVYFQKWMSASWTSGFNTDSLFWLMLQVSATHCRHKRIQLHALWFIKTSKESLSPFIDLPGAFSCLSTWSWQMDQNSFLPWKLVERLSGIRCHVFIGCVLLQGMIDRINIAMGIYLGL